MNYKVKKGLLYIGWYNMRNLFAFNKDIELDEQQKSFIAYWKNRINDDSSIFFQTVDENNQISYEIHNNKDNSYITLKNDYKDAVIDIFMIRNDTYIQYYTYIPVSTFNRLIRSFKSEMVKRSNFLKDKFNEKLVEDIKKLK
jgi:hypothetical protein